MHSNKNKISLSESNDLTCSKDIAENQYIAYLQITDNSVHAKHSSMQLSANPALKKLSLNAVNKEQLKEILIQYCFLPAEIVHLLNMARKRLSVWASIESELTRNINEELGSRTRGITHYDILANSLCNEVNLDIANSRQAPCTIRFIDSIKEFLASSSESSVLGAIYGLENAAVPELTIVATLINHYSMMIGLSKSVIRIPAERNYLKNAEANYSLNTFFAMHLLDFELGHKNGLAQAIKNQYAKTPLNFAQMESGFEFVLDQMDKWWEKLAAQ